MGRPTEISIRADHDVATLINVFTVEPGDQEKLIRVVKEGTETLVSKQPGYVSASAHRSKDCRRVVAYSQWRSAGDVEAFRNQPEAGEYLERVGQLAQFEPIVCDISFVHRL